MNMIPQTDFKSISFSRDCQVISYSLKEAIFLEDEAIETLCSHADLQEVREKIETSKTKLQEAIDLLNGGSSINVNSIKVNCEKDVKFAIWQLKIAIYFDERALQIIGKDSLWRRSAAVAYLMMANWFKQGALKIVE